MLSRLKKLLKKSDTVFKLLEPDIELTPFFSECTKALEGAGVKYNEVCNGYIVFPAKLFNGLDLMVGLHYIGDLVEYFEIFRPKEYYDSPDYDIKSSYSEIHDALVSCYGKPQVAMPGALSGFPSEKWVTRNFVLEHYIFDRFGPEEHIHFKLLHK